MSDRCARPPGRALTTRSGSVRDQQGPATLGATAAASRRSIACLLEAALQLSFCIAHFTLPRNLYP